jgi:hypothetical protein
MDTRYKNRTNIQPLQYTVLYRVCMLASVMYNLDRRVVPVYCSGCMFVLFLYRVCMLASVMYNLDRRFVPVYCSGCMFVLFNILVQNVYLNCTSQKLACTLGTKTEQTYNHYNILVQNVNLNCTPVYCSGCMCVLFLYRVCMLASVMYNLDRLLYQYIVVIVCLFCFCTECVC